jgi:hypothetical protein
MARTFKALGITAAGALACLWLALLSTHLGTPSEGLDHFAAFFVATPIVCLILFFASFFLLGSRERETPSDPAPQHSGRPDPPTRQSIQSESTSTAFDWIRMLASIVLSLVAGCGSFVLLGSFIKRNYDGGGWFDSLLADMVAFLLAPAFAIAGFLLVFYVVGLFRPKPATLEMDR